MLKYQEDEIRAARTAFIQRSNHNNLSAEQEDIYMKDLSFLVVQGYGAASMTPTEQAMVRALAAIDEAIGLPADGCNSTARTLEAIRQLIAAAQTRTPASHPDNAHT